MRKRPRLLIQTGEARAEPAFLLAYGEAVLLALHRRGLLSPDQLADCCRRLEEGR